MSPGLYRAWLTLKSQAREYDAIIVSVIALLWGAGIILWLYCGLKWAGQS